MKESSTVVDASMTVNQFVRLYPPSIGIFNRFGIDSCCGGAVPVRDAAQRDGADPDEVLAALAELIEAER
jgi:iron-sulfur cluster repair protein YtfE (RIC family)